LDSHLERSIATRMLDQRALEDAVLETLCEQDPQLRAQMARLQPERALPLTLRSVPLVGPLVQRVYRRIARRTGSGR
jgi:hypothetical protein